MTEHQSKIMTAMAIAQTTHQREFRKGSGMPYMCHIHDMLVVSQESLDHLESALKRVRCEARTAESFR